MIRLNRFFAFVFIALIVNIAMLFVYQAVYASHCDPGGHHDPNNPEECIYDEPEEEPKEDKPTKTPIYIPPTFTATSTETQTPTPTHTLTLTPTSTHTATSTQTPAPTATVIPNDTDNNSGNFSDLTFLLPILLLGGYGGFYAGERGCRRNRDGNLLGPAGSDDLLALLLIGGTVAGGAAAGDFSTVLPLILLTGGVGGYLGNRRCRRRRRWRRGLSGRGGYGNQGGLGGYF